MRPWVILGCGYTGERLAARLRATGTPVIATVRRPEAAAALAARLDVDARAVDVAAPDPFAGWIPPGAVVVDSVPPDPARPGGHQVALAAAVRAAGGDPRLVVLSTTGVYPRGDGGWIDEDTPVGPDGPRGAARLAAEHAVLSAGIDAVCLRIAAIYGPGRGVAERLRAGTYAVPGDGASWISRIHVDDLVSVILAAGTVRPLPRRIYVVADDAPSTSREHADGVAAMLGLPPPPSVPLASLSPLGRELAGSNRRVRNDRMKRELGVVLRYPSWREGVAADLRSG